MSTKMLRVVGRGSGRQKYIPGIPNLSLIGSSKSVIYQLVLNLKEREETNQSVKLNTNKVNKTLILGELVCYYT